MAIYRIDTLDDPRVAMFSRLTEAQLRCSQDAVQGIFIAESPKVIRVALSAGYEPLALLCEERHLANDARDLAETLSHVPIYIGARETLAALTGYTLTRGVLCAMRRPVERALDKVLHAAQRVVVIDGVTDTTNIGAMFRSAAALGVDAILLTRTSCDPLNRRSIRVSMGTVFQVPWTWIDQPQQQLNALGFQTAAMALTDQSIPLDAPCLKQIERLALIMGTEGDGLPQQTIAAADHVVRIPMKHGVDSLNVAAAMAVACWELRQRDD